MTTAYDRVAYPTTVFGQTHPERLAVLAKLAGLEAAPLHEARILEIGGGNCANLTAIAAAFPGCTAHGFDLSEMAIAKGMDFVHAAGLGNVELAVEDILQAAERYPAGSYDYVIAHGVYAWVPEVVRKATMALAAHALSDRGIAFISYNCLPGGHVRMIMREMLLDVMGGIDDPDQRLGAARDFLEHYARPQEGDEPLATTLRLQAQSMLERPEAVLFHDELGPSFHPQRMLAVVAEAEANGLRFLTDGGRNRHLDGFLGEGQSALADDPAVAEAAVLQACTQDDYRSLRYFRHSLFVRAERVPDRRIDVARIADLYVSARLRRQEDGSFLHGKDRIELADAGFAERVEQLSAHWPQRIPVGDLAQDPDQLRALLHMFNEWYVKLHTDPAPFAARPGAYPQTSPLVRGMFEAGELAVCTLNHEMLKIDQAELRALLMAADGSRTLAELGAMDHGIPADEVEGALTASCGHALLVA